MGKIFSLMPIPRRVSTLPTDEIVEFIKQSEACGFDGVLIPESNEGSIDVWTFSQFVLSGSKRLVPFIAINPNYAHPFFVARKIASLTNLYQRKLYINFITGTAKHEAANLGLAIKDTEKYARLTEYIHLVQQFLTSAQPVSFSGNYYSVKDLQVMLSIPSPLQPEYYVAGESENAIHAALQCNCFRLTMAEPRKKTGGQLRFVNEKKTDGFHLGVLARPTHTVAQETIDELYPPDRTAQLLFKYAMANTLAAWKINLYERLKENLEDPCFSLKPFAGNYSDLPFITGSYDEISAIIQNYFEEGLRTLIVELPQTNAAEFKHVSNSVFADQHVIKG